MKSQSLRYMAYCSTMCLKMTSFDSLGSSFEVKLTEKEKNRKLNDLLDALEFNQAWCCDRVPCDLPVDRL